MATTAGVAAFTAELIAASMKAKGHVAAEAVGGVGAATDVVFVVANGSDESHVAAEAVDAVENERRQALSASREEAIRAISS